MEEKVTRQRPEKIDEEVEETLRLFKIRIDAICASVVFRMKAHPRTQEIMNQVAVMMYESIEQYVRHAIPPKDERPTEAEKEQAQGAFLSEQKKEESTPQ